MASHRGHSSQKRGTVRGVLGRLSNCSRSLDDGRCRLDRFADTDPCGIGRFDAIHGEGTRNDPVAHTGRQALQEFPDVLKPERRKACWLLRRDPQHHFVLMPKAPQSPGKVPSRPARRSDGNARAPQSAPRTRRPAPRHSEKTVGACGNPLRSQPADSRKGTGDRTDLVAAIPSGLRVSATWAHDAPAPTTA